MILIEVFKRIIPLEPNIDKDEPVCHRTLNVGNSSVIKLMILFMKLKSI